MEKKKIMIETQNLNFYFYFSHTIPHLHSKQLELLYQWETFLDDHTCFLSPT
jgi:hypothetical protein